MKYRMCGWEFCDCDVGSGFVGFEGFICAVFAFVAKSEFSEVAVIISLPKHNKPLLHKTEDKNKDRGWWGGLHFVVKDFGLSGSSGGD